MNRIALIADLAEQAALIAEEMALNLMDGVKAQWEWAAMLTDVAAQLMAFYRDGYTVDLDLLAYCEFITDAAV